MKHLFPLLMILAAIIPLGAATWDGSYSTYWNHAANWSTESVPTSTTDVYIPNGLVNYPTVSGVSANCRNLTVYGGATLNINNQPLTVAQNFTNHGFLNMQSASSWLKVMGDATWYSGSTLVTSGYCNIDHYGDLNLESGSYMVMTAGFLRFMGSSLASFTNKSADTQIWHFENRKSYSASDPNSGRLFITNDAASLPFTIQGSLLNDVTACLFNEWTGDITLNGNLTTLGSYPYTLFSSDGGSWIMDGTNQTITLADDCYFYDIVCSQTGILTLQSDLDLAGDMKLESGTLNAGNNAIWLYGDWINTAGPDAFNEGTSTVSFCAPSGHQYCNYTEDFYRLQVSKWTSGALRIDNSAAVVTCAVYDWVAGGIDVLAGSFTASDLAENGVYGGYWVNPSGTINLSNPGSSLDMKDVIIVFTNGGTININGYGGSSNWEEIDLTMTGEDSRFSFNGMGIHIRDYASCSPSFNISAGTISTTGSFQNDSPAFIPIAGCLEMNGTAPSYLSLTAGSLFRLKINKDDLEDTVTLVTDITARSWFQVDAGTLDLSDRTLDVYSPSVISGGLVMNDSLAVLNAQQTLNFWHGSNTVINAGTIYCGASFIIYSTASFTMDPAAHLYMTHEDAGILAIHGEDAILGTLHIGTDETPAVCSLSDVDSNAILSVAGELHVHPGSTLDLNGDLEVANLIDLEGNLNIGSESMTGLSFFFLCQNATLNIDTGIFEVAEVNIMDGTLWVNSGSFITNSYLYINTTASVEIVSGLIQCQGLKAEHPGTLEPTGGLIRLINENAISGMGFFNVSAGNWVPDLEFDLPQAYTAIMEEDLTIKGDFDLISGVLDVGSHDIYISGNWSNLGGTYAVNNGRVVFNGSGHQYVNYTENFNIVEASKSGGAIRVDNAGAVVTIDQYDWTAGAVDVLAGTLTISDLADNGMYGGFYCTPGGILNITQDPAQTLNLYGLIQITGGTVNISGGSGADANWARYSPSTLNMSGGTLNYLDKGIQIRNTYAFTCSITDGIITTTGGLYCNRTDFVPEGGAFEMRGAADSNLDFQSAPGSSLYKLIISKDNLSVRVSQAASVQTIRGYLRIDNGTYFMQNRTLNCLGALTVNSDGMLSCQGSSTIKMAADKSININSGGYIDAVGTSSDIRVTFTHLDEGSFGFYVNNGGTLTANYILFEYMSFYGLNILNGGIIAGLHNCTFQNGTPGGTLMHVGNEQDIYITHANFPTDPGGGCSNVRKIASGGSVVFSDYSGAFSGAAFEDDTYDQVFWTGAGVNLRIAAVAWSRPDDYVCAPITAAVTVQNNGTHDLVGPVRVDLYKNLPSQPPAGTPGDLNLEISNLSVGNNKILIFTNLSSDVVETWRSWARVDATQVIPETNENDNLWYYIPNTQWLALPGVEEASLSPGGTGEFLLDWAYPVDVSRFNVYRSQDPYFIPGPGNLWSSPTDSGLAFPAAGDMWFYVIKAERDLP